MPYLPCARYNALARLPYACPGKPTDILKRVQDRRGAEDFPVIRHAFLRPGGRASSPHWVLTF